MVVRSVPTLPVYPSSATRKGIPPSQLSSLQTTISAALSAVLVAANNLEGSPLKASSLAFIESYAQDHAFTTLQSLIWDNLPQKTPIEQAIHTQVLSLAQVLADHGLLTNLKLLVDLSVTYARKYPSKTKKLFQTIANYPGSPIAQDIKETLVPSFTQILESSQGLYNQRKAAECIYSFILASDHGGEGQSLLKPFAQNYEFLSAVARLYLPRLANTARSYGGSNALLSVLNSSNDPTDPTEWTSIYLTTKLTLLDSFHLILKHILSDLTSAKAPAQLAARTEAAFSALFAIMDVTSNEPSSPPTPFLNYSLLQDYQHTHDLLKILNRVLAKASERDARLDLLDDALASVASLSGPGQKKNAGALKLLLRGSGLQIPARAKKSMASKEFYHDDGTATSAAPIASSSASKPIDDLGLASKVSQVLDLLPDASFDHVSKLLKSDRYTGNVERVIGALLDGSAPSETVLDREAAPPTSAPAPTQPVQKYERRNVFDDEVVNLDTVRFGKKNIESSNETDRLLREEIKADILRRVEVMDLSDEEDEEDIDPFAVGDEPAKRSKSKSAALDDGDDNDYLDLDDPAVRVPGADEDDDDESDVEIITSADGDMKRIEAILELAYASDASIFARDKNTRKSKRREELRNRTGWADDLIEGWAVMLERDPRKKDRILRKHEFRGNRASSPEPGQGEAGPSHHQGHRGGRGGRGGGRGVRGGGGGGNGGRGRGGATGRGGPGDSGGGDRVFKDRNKASRGNHNRKRGHDKKVASAGGPS